MVVAYSPESGINGGRLRQIHLLFTPPKVVSPEVNMLCVCLCPPNVETMDVETVSRCCLVGRLDAAWLEGS